jgi:hypothetical protein
MQVMAGARQARDWAVRRAFGETLWPSSARTEPPQAPPLLPVHRKDPVQQLRQDSTTLADGGYQLIMKPEGGYSEDPRNFVAEFSEAPNQSSEDLNFTDFSPTSKGKPRT